MGLKLAFYFIALGLVLSAIPWAAHRGWLPRMPRLRRAAIRKTRRRVSATHSMARMELADLNARATHETEGGVPEEPEAPEAQHVGDFLGAEAPVLERMGISVRDLGGGWSAAHLPIDRNANHHGTMHSGALFCAGELLSATVLASSFALEDCVPMIKNMAIEHHRPARSDVTATAYLDPQQAARMQRDLDASRRADWVFAAELRDSDGHSVATMKGDCQLRLRTGGARRALTPSE